MSGNSPRKLPCVEAIIAHIRSGMTMSVIASRYKTSSNCVFEKLQRNGLAYVGPSREPVGIPAWLPKELRREFIDIAKDHDEFAACQWAREAKREMALS